MTKMRLAGPMILPWYLVPSSPIAELRSYKLLGVHFDETLSFNSHVKFLTNKLSRSALIEQKTS